MSRPTPPRLASALLRRRVGSGPVGQSIQGDLWQECRVRREASGRFSAAGWYWIEVLGLLRPRAYHPGRPSRRLAGWGQDAVYAIRSLRASPGHAVLATLLLALGVGATTAIFAVTNSLFLRPPPLVEAPADLVSVYTSGFGGRPYSVSSYAEYEAVRDRVDVFESATTFMLGQDLRIGEAGAVQPIFGAAVAADYFRVLGVDLALGRGFTTDEAASTARDDVIILGHRTWSENFGADPEILRREVRVNGRLRRVVGVAPAGLLAPGFPVSVEGYIPTAGDWLEHRGTRSLSILGRLAAGATLDRAQTQLNTLARALHEEDPRYFSDRNDEARRLTAVGEFGSRLSPDVRGAAMAFMTMLLVGVGLVLAIACSNIAHLALVRAGTRGGDFAVRRALGAGHFRLVRLLLLENVAIGAVGGLLGIAAVAILIAAVPRLDVLPQGVQISLSVDWRVAGFAILTSLCTAVLFGLIPARRVASLDLTPLLRSSGQGALGGSSRLRGVLVVVQVAASITLLAVSALFLRSLQGTVGFDPGFNADGVAVARLELGQIPLATDEGLAALDTLTTRLAARPDVEGVTYATRVPVAGGWEREFVEIEGYDPTSEHRPEVSTHRVGDEYFDLMGIRVLRGRGFDSNDRAGSLPVAVVNEVFVEQYWSDRDPLGATLTLGGTTYRVVGVVQATKGRQLNEEPLTQMWMPVRQSYRASTYIHVRYRGDDTPAEFLAAVRGAVRETMPTLPFLDPVWMTSMTANATLPQRLASRVLGAAGLAALLLAAIGLHAVVAYGVSQRTAEIGVRVALGADQSAILRATTQSALRLTGVGTAIGLPFAVAAGQMANDLLVGTSPLDPLALGGAVVVLAVAAMAACVGPARRAAAIDPVTALRRH